MMYVRKAAYFPMESETERFILNETMHSNQTIDSYETEVRKVLIALRFWYMPIVIFAGIIGNLLALCTIFLTKLREAPPNHYLAALTVSDTIFLISLIPVWRGIYSHTGICQAFTYLLNVSSWISSWATTALTVERYFVIFYPLSMLAYCDVRKARLVILGILPVPVVFNFWVFLTHEVRHNVCTVVRHFKASFTLSIVDSVLVFGAPSVLLTVLNIAIVTKLLKDQVRPKPKKTKKIRLRLSITDGNIASDQQTVSSCSQQSEMLSGRHHKQGNSQRRKITGLLIAVPCIFVILNLPYYAIRFRNYVMVGLSSSQPTIIDLIANQVAAMLYFTNYAIDFFLYAFSSANFRQATVTMFRRKLTGNRYRCPDTSLLPLSPKSSSSVKSKWRNGNTSEKFGFSRKSANYNRSEVNGGTCSATDEIKKVTKNGRRRFTQDFELKTLVDNGSVQHHHTGYFTFTETHNRGIAFCANDTDRETQIPKRKKPFTKI